MELISPKCCLNARDYVLQVCSKEVLMSMKVLQVKHVWKAGSTMTYMDAQPSNMSFSVSSAKAC